ncbi:MAG: peptidoglycan-binding domain-containing protein [Candidatus Electrothrix gigas]
MSNITNETPHAALTNLTETIKCMGKAIKQSESPAILLLVDDFYDGTVPIITDSKALVISSMRQNGPLADAGKYDFEAIIKRSVSGKKIIIPYSLPIGLVKENIFGRLDKKYLLGLAKMYKAAGIIRVKGVFTQNDSSEYYSKGIGTNDGVDGKHGEAEIEYGSVQGSKSISLVVHLGNAMNNTLVGATTLTLNTHSKKNELSIGFGYGEGGISFTREIKIEEGLHGAQRTLVEAAAMWVLRGLYNKVDFSQCLGDQGPAPQVTVSAYQKWLEFDSQTGIKYLKLMLRELKYYSGKIDSNYDRQLQKAVASYEADNDLLIPHTQNNLGDLFILLYPKVDFEKIENQLQKIMDFDSEPAEQRGRVHSLKQEKQEKTLPGKTTKKFDAEPAEQRGRVHSPKLKKQEKTLPGKTTKKIDADPAEPAEQRRRVHSPKLKKQEKTLPGKTTKKFDAEPAEQRGRVHSPKPKKQEKTLPGKTTKSFDSDPAKQRGRVHSPKPKKQEKSLPVKTTKDVVSNTTSLVY